MLRCTNSTTLRQSLLSLCLFCTCLSTLVVSDMFSTFPRKEESTDEPPRDKLQEIGALLAQTENCCHQNYFVDLNAAIKYAALKGNTKLEARVIKKRRTTFTSCKSSFEQTIREKLAQLEPTKVESISELVDSIQANIRARPEMETTPSDEWAIWKREPLVESILAFMDQRGAFGSSKLTEKAFDKKYNELVGGPCSNIRDTLSSSAGIISMYLMDKDLTEGVSEVALYWARVSNICYSVLLDRIDVFEAYNRTHSSWGRKLANSIKTKFESCLNPSDKHYKL